MKGWETSVGLSGMQQSNTNRGLEFLIPEYSFFDIGGFEVHYFSVFSFEG